MCIFFFLRKISSVKANINMERKTFLQAMTKHWSFLVLSDQICAFVNLIFSFLSIPLSQCFMVKKILLCLSYGLGTSNAIYILQSITERALEVLK